MVAGENEDTVLGFQGIFGTNDLGVFHENNGLVFFELPPSLIRQGEIFCHLFSGIDKDERRKEKTPAQILQMSYLL